MRYIQSILELWCLLFICFIWGRRILDLGPCWIKRQLGLYLAPGLGLASILWFVSLFGRFMPMRSIYSFSFTLLLVIFSLLKEHRQREFWQQSKWLGLFAAIGSLPVFAPEIRYGGYSPFTDIFTYLAQSQWLQTHAFSEKILTTAYHPAWSQIALYQSTGARMGGTFFLSFVQSLFHLTWSYDAYLPTVALGVISGCLFLGAIIRQVVPLKHGVTLALSLMPAVLSSGFIYGAEWGFFPQTYGLAFAFGLAALLPILLKQVLAADLNWKAYFLYALPTSLCGAAMLLAYNEPFPLFFGGIGLFMLFIMAIHVKRVKALCLISFVLILELTLLMNTELIRLIHNIYQTLTISHGHLSIGWPVLWHPARFIAFSFGLTSYFTQPMWLEHLMNWVITPIGLLVLLYLLARFMQQHPKRHLVLGLLFL